ncbi:MAG: FtsX-like permease family protein [Synechococcus sp. SB0668_bin_15]|nr:FtsX-like permease family protein [Synechococcus sp. SB0668_bin_15]MXZ82372.1 FtsX-like permease family protein [Synechococcus sp. SB0666_bin_14]MYA90898.1 FtsX-like permease family protein [Synechococcus sp. SB0663_bin_10]MYC49467.1 FtsX-like permease family protein [Synechococcus sp. SB0662_bin_14]MYG46927.1 FtsX-like permease family protein [Synechococcus sp. SB0675_bin_6]
MALPWRETWSMAWSALRASPLRSLLTVLGIVIGNASVIILVGIGQGTQKLANEQLDSLGSNVLFVVPGDGRRRSSAARPRTLVLEDAEAIASQVPSVRRVAPQISSNQIIRVEGRSTSVPVYGVTPEFLLVRQFDVERGHFIAQSDFDGSRSVVVLGSALASKLSPGADPLGQRIRIGTSSFVVIGVMEEKGSFFGENQDEVAYVPLSTMVNRITGRDPTYGVSLTFVSVEANDQSKVNAANFQITNLLRQRHKIPDSGEDDFVVRTQKEAAAIVTTITGGLTILLGSIGGVSLLVGGVGIMNIMLVAVSERTAEVGLRKALGARRRDVLLQFLIEAAVLASMGGIIGSGLGLGAVTLVAAVTPLPAFVGPGTVVLAVGVSGGIGVFFGVVPARRAARLDPIAALRRL